MKKIEDIFLPLNINREKKPTFTTSPTERPNNSVSLRKWLGNLFKGFNGITFDPSTFSFKLGGTIDEDIEILIKEGKNFTIVGENGNGIFQVDDSGNSIFIGSSQTNTGLYIYPDGVNIQSIDELNITSTNLAIRDGNNNTYLELFVDSGNPSIRTPSLPTYADEAEAVTGGLGTNEIYKTPTGELRIKL
jgi:hypothetical protein